MSTSANIEGAVLFPNDEITSILENTLNGNNLICWAFWGSKNDRKGKPIDGRKDLDIFITDPNGNKHSFVEKDTGIEVAIVYGTIEGDYIVTIKNAGSKRVRYDFYAAFSS